MSYDHEKDDYGPTTAEYDQLEKDFFRLKTKYETARQIISDFVCSEISYMNINNLGDPFKQQDVKRAVKFLLDE